MKSTELVNRLIVVVDDSATNRLLLAMYLEQQGFTSSCHPRWSEAERQVGVGGARLSALILDCWLADEDAAAIIRDLRTRAECRDLPILVVADADDDRLVDCLEAGANDLLIRPIQSATLGERLAALGVRSGS